MCTLKLHTPNIRQSEKMWPSANMKLAGLTTLIWDLAASHAGGLSRPSLSLQIPACTCSVRELAQFGSGASRQQISHTSQSHQPDMNEDLLQQWSFGPQPRYDLSSGDESSVYRYLIKDSCGLTLNNDDTFQLQTFKSRKQLTNDAAPVPGHPSAYLGSAPRAAFCKDMRLALSHTAPVAIAATALKFMEQPWVTTDDCYCC